MVKRFGNFKLSEREEVVVELNQCNVKKSKEDCEKSLVRKIFGDNPVNFTSLKQTMTQLWCPEGSLKVIELRSKTFQFVFSRENEKRKALKKRPRTFDNQLLVLHPWKMDIDVEEDLFQRTQMWIQMWHIPVQWLSSEIVWKARKIFKQCYIVIIPKSGSKEERYAKMLVEVDLTKPLLKGTKISFEGEQRWVMFKYEQFPSFCFYCRSIGHGERRSGMKISYLKNLKLHKGQYGEWLRAMKGRTGSKERGFPKKSLITVAQLENRE